MIRLDAGNASAPQLWRQAYNDQATYAICLVSATGDTAREIAEGADAVTGGFPWRRVVWDNGCDVIDAATRKRYFKGHDDAVAVFLDSSAPRRPVAWASAGDIAYELDKAFRTAESAGVR